MGGHRGRLEVGMLEWSNKKKKKKERKKKTIINNNIL